MSVTRSLLCIDVQRQLPETKCAALRGGTGRYFIAVRIAVNMVRSGPDGLKVSQNSHEMWTKRRFTVIPRRNMWTQLHGLLRPTLAIM
jgi:hypothetical protein